MKLNQRLKQTQHTPVDPSADGSDTPRAPTGPPRAKLDGSGAADPLANLKRRA
jgi:hypothetical protein